MTEKKLSIVLKEVSHAMLAFSTCYILREQLIKLDFLWVNARCHRAEVSCKVGRVVDVE